MGTVAEKSKFGWFSIADLKYHIDTDGLTMSLAAKTVAAAIDSAKTSADKAKKYEDKIKEGIVLSAGMAMPYGLIHLPA